MPTFANFCCKSIKYNCGFFPHKLQFRLGGHLGHVTQMPQRLKVMLLFTKTETCVPNCNYVQYNIF